MSSAMEVGEEGVEEGGDTATAATSESTPAGDETGSEGEGCEDLVDGLCFRSFLTLDGIEEATREDEANRPGSDSDEDDSEEELVDSYSDIWQYPWAGEGCGMSPVYSTTDRFEYDAALVEGGMSSSREGSMTGPRCSTSMDSGIGLSPGMEFLRSSPASTPGRRKVRRGWKKQRCETYIPRRGADGEGGEGAANGVNGPDNCENVGAGKSMLMDMLLTAGNVGHVYDNVLDENGEISEQRLIKAQSPLVYKGSRNELKVRRIKKLGPTGKRQYIRRMFKDKDMKKPLKRCKLKRNVSETVVNGAVCEQGEDGVPRKMACVKRLDGKYSEANGDATTSELLKGGGGEGAMDLSFKPGMSPHHRPSMPRKKRIRRMKQMKGFICDISTKTLGFEDAPPKANPRRIALPEPVLENGFRKCSLCGFSSKYSPSLARHKAVVHGVVTPGQKVFKCPYCPFITTYKSKYIRHVKLKHPEEVKEGEEVRLNKQQITEEMAAELVKIDGARCRKKWKENAVTIPNGCEEGGEEGATPPKKKRVRVVTTVLPNGEVVIKPKRKYVRKKPLPGKKLPAGAEPSSSTPTAALATAPTTVSTVPTPTTPQPAQGAPMDYSFQDIKQIGGGGGVEEEQKPPAATADSKQASSPQTAITEPLTVHIHGASLPVTSLPPLSTSSSSSSATLASSPCTKQSLLEACLTTPKDKSSTTPQQQSSPASSGTILLASPNNNPGSPSASLTPQEGSVPVQDNSTLSSMQKLNSCHSSNNPHPGKSSTPPPPPPAPVPQVNPPPSNVRPGPSRGLDTAPLSSLPAIPPLHRTSTPKALSTGTDQDMPIDLSVSKKPDAKESGVEYKVPIPDMTKHLNHSMASSSKSQHQSDSFTPPVPPLKSKSPGVSSTQCGYPSKVNHARSGSIPGSLWTPYNHYQYNNRTSPAHSPRARSSYAPFAHSPTSSISSQLSSASSSFIPNAPSLGHSPSPSPTPPLHNSTTPPLSSPPPSHVRRHSASPKSSSRRPSSSSTPPAAYPPGATTPPIYPSSNKVNSTYPLSSYPLPGTAFPCYPSSRTPPASYHHQSSKSRSHYPPSSKTPPAYHHPKSLSGYPSSKTPPGYSKGHSFYPSSKTPPGYSSSSASKMAHSYNPSKTPPNYPVAKTPPSYPMSKTPPASTKTLASYPLPQSMANFTQSSPSLQPDDKSPPSFSAAKASPLYPFSSSLPSNPKTSSAPCTPHRSPKSPSSHSNPEVRSRSLQGQGQLMRAPPPVTIEDLLESQASTSPFMAQFEQYMAGYAGPLEIRKVRNKSWINPDEKERRNGEILTVPEIGILKEEELLNNEVSCHISKLSTIVQTLNSTHMDTAATKPDLSKQYAHEYKDTDKDSSIGGDMEIGPPLLEPMVTIDECKKAKEKILTSGDNKEKLVNDDDAQSGVSDKTIILEQSEIKVDCKVKMEDEKKSAQLPSPCKTRLTRSRAQTEEVVNDSVPTPRTGSFLKGLVVPDNFDFLPKFQSKASKGVMRLAAKQKKMEEAEMVAEEQDSLVKLCQGRLVEMLHRYKDGDMKRQWEKCREADEQKQKEKKARRAQRKQQKKADREKAALRDGSSQQDSSSQATDTASETSSLSSQMTSHCCHSHQGFQGRSRSIKDTASQTDCAENSTSRRNSQEGTEEEDDEGSENGGATTTTTTSSTHWKVTNKQRFLRHDARHNKSGSLSVEEMREMVHDSIKDIDLEDAGADRWRVRHSCCHSNHGTQTSHMGFYLEDYDNFPDDDDDDDDDKKKEGSGGDGGGEKKKGDGGEENA